MKNHRDWGL